MKTRYKQHFFSSNASSTHHVMRLIRLGPPQAAAVEKIVVQVPVQVRRTADNDPIARVQKRSSIANSKETSHMRQQGPLIEASCCTYLGSF